MLPEAVQFKFLSRAIVLVAVWTLAWNAMACLDDAQLFSQQRSNQTISHRQSSVNGNNSRSISELDSAIDRLYGTPNKTPARQKAGEPKSVVDDIPFTTSTQIVPRRQSNPADSLRNNPRGTNRERVHQFDSMPNEIDGLNFGFPNNNKTPNQNRAFVSPVPDRSNRTTNNTNPPQLGRGQATNLPESPFENVPFDLVTSQSKPNRVSSLLKSQQQAQSPPSFQSQQLLVPSLENQPFHIPNDTNVRQNNTIEPPASQNSPIQIAELPFAAPSSNVSPRSRPIENQQQRNQSSQSNRPTTTPNQLASANTTTSSPAPSNPNPRTPTGSAPANPNTVKHDTTKFTLAGQPKMGARFDHHDPHTSQSANLVPYSQFDFSPDPIDPTLPYDPGSEIDVYQGKTLNSNQRPLLELGRPWYQLGQLQPGYTFFGSKNLITPQFLVFGDYRQAISSATQNANNQSFLSFELNLFFDLKITSTERIHFNMTPLDNGQNSKFRLDDDLSFDNQLNPNVNFGFFEGDLGAIVGGFTDENLPFDAPFAIGVMPLLFQNGVWLEDAFLGVAATIPARNSPFFDISNMDTTFFYGWDRVTSNAFEGQDNQGKIYGVANFIEALGGYFEVDYAFLEDRNGLRNRSYHNVGIGYTRRYGRFVSNSMRVIANAGQDTTFGENTADGVLLLSENSFITNNPSTFIPYANFFAGFDRPQSAARAAAAGGILRNTGILFESDGMTNFPTLDDSANDTFGGALGFNILAKDFSQQLILEAAMLKVHGNHATRNACGDQYGLGFRYQLPITNADIIRLDGMLGFFDDRDDVNGLRVEYRHKW